MKILTYSLLIFGFVLLALGRPSSDHPNYPVMIIGAAMTIVAAILLSRLRFRVSKCEVADKDKTQAREMRHDSGIRGLFARFIGYFGFISCVAGITYPLYADSHPDLAWRDAIRCVIFGAFLLFCSWLLVRRSRL